jgi:lipopolysaccharide export system permease protein
MIRILDKYISKTVLNMIFLVAFALLALEIFIEFTREFHDIGSGEYGLLQVLAYVPLVLPLDIYQLFPMVGLLGSLLGLGGMATHSELIVMRAAGFSFTQITQAVLKLALLITVLMFFVGEVLAPVMQHLAISNKTTAISGGQALLTHQGVWIRDANNFVHIAKVLPKGHLEAVTKYEFNDENQLLSSSFAKTGEYQNGQWILSDVTQTLFSNGDNKTHVTKTSSLFFAKQNWDIKLKPRLMGLANIDVDQKSLLELHNYIKYREQSGLITTNYEFSFWQRLFQPLATLVMILLAVPFIFGPLRTTTMGVRMLAGAIAGFGFHMLNQFVGPMSMVYQVPPILAAILPTVIATIFGSILLIKIK